ncbi:hypothetical protein PF002_g1330 [Phytophthora fragariae]|uniref:Uncharacterized protein n=2 Tax=Phytophthora fragariae TaxID=53985 RepID=A0A6A3MNZ9_9STRA|nr:hypothetical protein PF011_g940 [Phytophthora fragariae]KAE9257131.1 hypothetical protein PF002_g1330 [Phytophthora fragariae]
MMGPLKKKITAKWLADISVPEEDSQPTAVKDESVCRKCGLVELCVCWEESTWTWMLEVTPRSNVATDEQQSVRDRQTTNQAAEKRLATIIRTIEAWEELSEDVIVKSFQKAIPMYPTIDV